MSAGANALSRTKRGHVEIIRPRRFDERLAKIRLNTAHIVLEMPLFSVVIPSFNRVALLATTLKSVFAQRFTDFEIIVVDDGSTDATMDYLESLEHRVKVFGQQNQGPGAARNRGARHSGGAYLAFLDSDDLW